MILNNNQIINILQEIKNAFNYEKKNLPLKYLYPIVKNINTLENLKENFEFKRLNILNKYGRSEDKTLLFFSDQNQQLANQEISKLLSEENNLIFEKIQLKDLIKDNIKFSIKQIKAIYFMIEE